MAAKILRSHRYDISAVTLAFPKHMLWICQRDHFGAMQDNKSAEAVSRLGSRGSASTHLSSPYPAAVGA